MIKVKKKRAHRYLSDSSDTLSPNQVGEMLGITGEAVKQWIYTRKLVAVRMPNGYWRINRTDLQSFLDSRQKSVLPRLLAFVRDSIWTTLKDSRVTDRYLTLRANNYADAILKIASWKPMIVVVDIDHLQPDGWRTLRHKVRAQHYLAVTSKVQDDETVLRLVECGVAGSLTPNATAQDFVAQCRTLWQDKAR